MIEIDKQSDSRIELLRFKGLAVAGYVFTLGRIEVGTASAFA